ncbi:hypothetical protein [Massilia endophytica]|uniref:hypothetical protein n=1 Tax=Massilia endophytica TaxID=2899220 RepID=UPI001E58B22B|nr:hypothetical protein [Massilia endophytica]UGQ45344.1 hypothetical protein LSQ66_16310 [Massilia endophytica]
MNQAFDASIPVLTEVVREEAPAPAPAPAPEPAAEASFLGTDWEQFEKEVSVRILQQLQSRVDFVLEQRIRDSIAEVLDQSLRELTGQLREGLHDTLGKIVTRAVQQEITHLQARKK